MLIPNRMVVEGLLLFLAGCGSSPPARYYSLQPLELDHRADTSDPVVLYLGPLRLPEYVSRSQIVTRGDGAELIVDDYHRWAEPLDDAITRIVAVNVDNLIDGLIVVPFPGGNLVEADYRLQGSLVRFDSDAAGRAVMMVQWSVATPDGDLLVPPRRSRFEARVVRTEDPDAIVIALNDTVTQFSRSIAAEIEARLE